MFDTSASAAQLPVSNPSRTSLINPVVRDAVDRSDALLQQWSFLADVIPFDAETDATIARAFGRRDYDRVEALLRPFFRLVVVIEAITERRRWLAEVQWFDAAGRASDIDCFEAFGRTSDDAATDLTARLDAAYLPGWDIVRLVPVGEEIVS